MISLERVLAKNESNEPVIPSSKFEVLISNVYSGHHDLGSSYGRSHRGQMICVWFVVVIVSSFITYHDSFNNRNTTGVRNRN
jgi:hypothetical protein